MIAIDIEVNEVTYTARMIGKPSKHYPGTYHTPEEPSECEFIIEDENGVEVELCGFDEDIMFEVQDDLIKAYWESIRDEKAQYRLDQARGK